MMMSIYTLSWQQIVCFICLLAAMTNLKVVRLRQQQQKNKLGGVKFE